MSDYTDIQPELDDFKNAVYGEEVRDSMISAIKKIHDIAESAAGAPDATTATAGQSPIADGQGGWAWGDVQGGGSGGQPTPVNLASDMTDTSKIYLYLGNESGYQYGYIYAYTNGAWTSMGLYGRGQNGANGADGYSPTATVSQTATGVSISITDKSGTTSATVENGTATDAQVEAWLDEHPEATTTVQDGSITKAKFASSAVFSSTENGLVPAPTSAKAKKNFVLAGNGKFEKVAFDNTACKALISILRNAEFSADMSENIDNLAEMLGITEGGDDLTFQYGQHITKGNTARTLAGLESYNLTELRIVLTLDSDFQQGAFACVNPSYAGSPYIGVDGNGQFYWSNKSTYSESFTATPSDLTSFVGDEPKEVKIVWNNPSGYESRKYMNNTKLFFNNYNPSAGFTLYRLSGYDGATKLFELISEGTNGTLYDTVAGANYTFDTTNGLDIVEVGD